MRTLPGQAVDNSFCYGFSFPNILPHFQLYASFFPMFWNGLNRVIEVFGKKKELPRLEITPIVEPTLRSSFFSFLLKG